MMLNYRNYPATLCWECKNATGGCTWSKDFKPVENWEAIPTTIKQRDNRLGRYDKVLNSYIVISCPQFVKG